MYSIKNNSEVKYLHIKRIKFNGIGDHQNYGHQICNHSATIDNFRCPYGICYI